MIRTNLTGLLMLVLLLISEHLLQAGSVVDLHRCSSISLFCSLCQVPTYQLELVTQAGHSRPLEQMTFSADGKYVLTGAADSTILWDSSDGRKLRAFSGKNGVLAPNAKITATNFAETGKWGETVLWHSFSGLKMRTVKGSPLAFSADSDRILTIDKDVAVLWDITTGNKIRTFAGNPYLPAEKEFAEARILAAVVSRDATRLATIGGFPAFPTTSIWDVASGARLSSIQGINDQARGCFSPDGRIYMSPARGKDDGPAEVISWNVLTGKRLKSVPVPIDWDNAFSPDSSLILLKTGVYDLSTGEKKQNFPAGDDMPLAFLPDGKRFATSAFDGSVSFWDLATGTVVLRLGDAGSQFASVSMSNEGQLAVSGGRSKSAALLWDFSTGQMTHRLPVSTSSAAVKLSANGKLLLINEPSFSSIWNAKTGSKIRGYAHQFDPRPIGFLENSDGLLAYDINGQPVKLPIEKDRKIAESVETRDFLAQSPDGKVGVLPGENDSIQLWNVTENKLIRTISAGNYTIPGWAKEIATNPDNFTCYCFSPDGSRLVTGHESNLAHVWNVNTGRKLMTCAGHAGLVVSGTAASFEGTIRAVAFSPDGKLFATASKDSTAILWNAATGKKQHLLQGHTNSLNSIFFSNDSKRAVTGSIDGTIRIWDVASGKELAQIQDFSAGADWLVVTPEGLFDGSPDASRHLAYRISGTIEMVSLERYQQKYWSPGLLAKIWKGDQPLPKVDISKSLPPVISFASNLRHGMEVRAGSLAVEVNGQSRSGYPIKRFRLLVDGRPYRGQLGVFEVVDPRPGEQHARWEVELDPGRHKLKVLADTEYVQGTSEELEIKSLGSDISSVELPELFVLSIGISKHSVSSRSLDYADRDARAIAEAFQTHSKSIFHQIETKVITNEQATRKGIFNGMQWLRQQTANKPSAVGIVFYAGHGEKDPRDGVLYFLPYDSEENDFAGSAIEADTLKKQLSSISGRLVLILDACHSGEIGAERHRGTGVTDQLLRDLTAEENGLAVMCSALGHQKSLESRQFQHGMFTQALLEGVAGNGNGEDGEKELKVRKQDGGVYLSELNAYVAARVRQLTQGYQSPISGTPRFVRDFPVSRP